CSVVENVKLESAPFVGALAEPSTRVMLMSPPQGRGHRSKLPACGRGIACQRKVVIDRSIGLCPNAALCVRAPSGLGDARLGGAVLVERNQVGAVAIQLDYVTVRPCRASCGDGRVATAHPLIDFNGGASRSAKT